MLKHSPLITVTDKGLYCAAGNFYIDPWQPVETALVTHAHADHARWGMGQYVGAASGQAILQHRMGEKASVSSLPYGQAQVYGDVTVSFHPAGHVLGSAQIRVDDGNEVWVVTGDYKRDPDPTCAPFEPLPCDVLITEATFGLPIYHWQPTPHTAQQIVAWWNTCREDGNTALLMCYALGKAQRLLAELHKLVPDREAALHGALVELTQLYRKAGVPMLATRPVSEFPAKYDFKGELVLCPPSALRSPWSKRFKAVSTAFASGWMQIRGNRRRRGVDRGFVLSDHADWPSLLRTVQETGTKKVLVTHGSKLALSQYLQQQGINAHVLETFYEGDEVSELSESPFTEQDRTQAIEEDGAL